MRFRVAACPPRDIIFGYQTLFEHNIMILNPEYRAKSAATLVKNQKKPDKGELSDANG